MFDSLWNKGILECVPCAFMNAFVTLLKSTPDAPAMSLPSLFKFLPANPSLISLLELVRSGIKEKVLAEDIVLCQSYASQKIFCKASEVSRLKPAFWTILHNAREYGVDLKNLSTHGTTFLALILTRVHMTVCLNCWKSRMWTMNGMQNALKVPILSRK